jgi:hypothetical protein
MTKSWKITSLNGLMLALFLIAQSFYLVIYIMLFLSACLAIVVSREGFIEQNYPANRLVGLAFFCLWFPIPAGLIASQYNIEGDFYSVIPFLTGFGAISMILLPALIHLHTRR